MKNTKMFSKRLLAMMLAFCMVVSMLPMAFAEGDVTENGAESTAEYNVTVRENITGGTVLISDDSVAEGDTVTLTVSADEGYQLTRAGYWTVDEEGNEGEIKIVTADDYGVYSFAMPASSVKVGAVFQESDSLHLIGNRVYDPTDTEKKDPLTFYASFGVGHIKESATQAWTKVLLDARFLDGEYADDDLKFTFQLREHDSTAYYHIVSEKHYTVQELRDMDPTLSSDGTYYIFDNFVLNVEDGYIPGVEGVGSIKGVLTPGWMAYCYMEATKDSWVDVKGNPASRNHSTQVDAPVIKDSAKELIPTVFLYNLEENTYPGYLLRQYLEGVGITFFDITNETLKQNLGYLAGWEGYEAVSPEEAYSPEVFDFNYVFMANLSEVQLDAFLNAINDNNLPISNKSVLTVWGASRNFIEMTDYIAAEDASFKAVLALGFLMVEVDKLYDADYENHPQWKELQEAWDEAYTLYSSEDELEAEVYNEAREKLLGLYLAVTGKVQLAGELEIVPTENEDGTYTIVANIHKKEGDEDKEFTFDYDWYTGTGDSDAETITVAAEDVYKVDLTITGTENTYGSLHAKLSIPSDPEVSVTADDSSISVNFGEVAETMNMPEVIGYVAQLYLGNELVAEKEIAEAGTITFDGLTAGTAYQLKTHSYNVVGYSTIEEQTVTTKYTDGAYGVTVRDGIIGGSVKVSSTTAKEGDTVTIEVTAEEGYVLGSVGYWTITDSTDENGNTTQKLGSVKELIANQNEDGTYSFTMPARNVGVGASFQNVNDEPLLINNKIGGTNDSDWFLYVANANAYLRESDRSGAARIVVDKRFVELEGVTMNLEARQYSTGGYTLIGRQSYTGDELAAFFADAEQTVSEHTLSDGSDVEVDTLTKDITIDLYEDKSFITGESVYYALQFSRDSWISAKGDAMYRWGYNMMHSTVLADDANERSAIVWLYNLDENSHRGSLIRSILAELNIPVGTVTNENLNQNIGYLVGWDGYEAVEDPYSPGSYDVEYILMGNLSELQMDAFLGSMMENNIRVNLKSQPTAWTAGKTFAELFDIMADEDAAFQAIFALDDLIYDAEQVDENEYSDNSGWAEFQEALDFAIARLTMEGVPDGEEAEAEFFWEGYDRLLAAYLALTEKTLLEGDAELVLEKQEDGTYSITAKVDGQDKMAEGELAYLWQDKSTDAAISGIAAEDLYKVKVEVSGTNGYYGTITGSLSVPADPKVTLSATKNSITVSINDKSDAINTPEIEKYVAELYDAEGNLLQTIESETGKIKFEDLTKKTDYTVKTYVYNVIGRGNIQEEAITTKSGSSGGGGSSSSSSAAAPAPTATPEPTATPAPTTAPEATATPEATEAPEVTVNFTDLGGYDWAADSVNKLVSGGVIKGRDDSTFAPGENITRADYAILLVRAFDLESENTENFADVNESDYYASELAVARNTGIVGGVGDNNYAPKNSITREDMMVIVYRALTALGYELDGGEVTAPDYDEVSDYAKEAVSALMANGLVNGKYGNIDPKANTTRAEVAVLLARVLEFVQE